MMFHIIHGTDAPLYLETDAGRHTPVEVITALRVQAAAEALYAAASALPKAALTHDIRAALAQYRAARKKVAL